MINLTLFSPYNPYKEQPISNVFLLIRLVASIFLEFYFEVWPEVKLLLLYIY